MRLDRTTSIGQNLNAYLTKTDSGKPLPLAAAHLLFSANRWEAAAALNARLAAGTTLIVDRYSYSGAVYTSAKASISSEEADRNMTLEWTWAPEVGLPAPDKLLFLDIEEQVAEQRGGFGSERYETTDMQRAVRTTFYQLLERLEPQRRGMIARINANHEMDAISADIWTAMSDVRHKLGEERLPPLRMLQSLPPVATVTID